MARRDGRTVAWIDRGGEPPRTPPDYRIRSLAEVLEVTRGVRPRGVTGDSRDALEFRRK